MAALIWHLSTQPGSLNSEYVCLLSHGILFLLTILAQILEIIMNESYSTIRGNVLIQVRRICANRGIPISWMIAFLEV